MDIYHDGPQLFDCYMSYDNYDTYAHKHQGQGLKITPFP